jgi:hypothetical protein
MRCLSESFLIIDWDEEYDILYLEWKYYPGSEQYQESLNLALNLARSKNVVYWIAHITQSRHATPEDFTWVSEVWFPELISTPIKKFAIILPQNVFQEMVGVYLNRLNVTVLPFEIEFFDQPEQAYNWVRNERFLGPNLSV